MWAVRKAVEKMHLRICDRNATGRPFVAFADDIPFRCSPEFQESNLVDTIHKPAGLIPQGATLDLRKTKNAPSGNGLFHTLAPSVLNDKKPERGLGKKCSSKTLPSFDPAIHSTPFNQLVSHQTRLALRWKSVGEILSPDEPQPYVIGEFLEQLPSRIGQSDPYDLALGCMMDSIVAFSHRSRQNLVKACSMNSKACASLRSALRANDGASATDNIMIAISFLRVAESMIDAATGNERAHSNGLINLMQQTSKQGSQCTEACVMMFWATATSQLLPSILRGEDCVFDTPCWLKHSTPRFISATYPSPEIVERYLVERYICLPRLVRLVRRVREAFDDPAALVEVTELATDLYRNTLEDWIEQLFDLGLVWRRPATPRNGSPEPKGALHFRSERIYIRFAAYWHLRTLICGCVLTLCNSYREMSLPNPFDACSVAAHDIEDAAHVLSCTDYALRAQSPVPLRQVKHLQSVVHSFGAWHRLGKRAVSNEEREAAETMKGLILDFKDDLRTRWTTSEWTVEQLEQLSEISAGGPLPSAVRSS